MSLKTLKREFCPNDGYLLQERLVSPEGDKVAILLTCAKAGCDYEAVIHYDTPKPDPQAIVTEILQENLRRQELD